MPDLDVSAKPRLTEAIRAVRRWPMRRWVAAAVGGLASALVVGIPTGVVPTPLYTRMTPVQWWNYPVLVATVALTGLAIATYVRPAADNNTRMGGMTGGGLLSAFAIGCPICNKLVVAALGVSGALNIWAPIQPFLGLSGLALIGFALIHRLRGEVSCSVPIPLAPDSVSTRRRSARLDPSSLQGGSGEDQLRAGQMNRGNDDTGKLAVEMRR